MSPANSSFDSPASRITPPQPAQTRLSWGEYGLIATFGLVVFGVCLVSGRVLSLHEAVLPETVREMLIDHDLVVPKKGGAPWLENPPLPQWVTLAVCLATGHCDNEAVVRVGSVLAGIAGILLTAAIAARLFGRTIGLLSGLVLTTLCEFTRYSWLAEDEIYLAVVVTAAMWAFLRIEFDSNRQPFSVEGLTRFKDWWRILIGPRDSATLLFFVMLGATNMVKGLIFGMAQVLFPIGLFLLLAGDWRRIARYVWLPGLAVTAVIMFAWPVAVSLKHPDAYQVWFFDFGGRVDGSYSAINEPIWYYAVNILWMVAPWTLVIPLGFIATWQRCRHEANSPARILWLWALAVPLMLSIPHGKHHHYLLPSLTPWAILGAIGAVEFRRIFQNWPAWIRHPALSTTLYGSATIVALVVLGDRIPGPAAWRWGTMVAVPAAVFAMSWTLARGTARSAAVAVFGSFAIAFAAGHCYWGIYLDKYRHDVTLVQQAKARAESSGEPLLLDMEADPAFIQLFYAGKTGKALHNLTFLADRDLPPGTALLITSKEHTAQLDQYARWEVLAHSERSLKPREQMNQFQVVRIWLAPQQQNLSSQGVRISPMQAMRRADGPFLTLHQ